MSGEAWRRCEEAWQQYLEPFGGRRWHWSPGVRLGAQVTGWVWASPGRGGEGRVSQGRAPCGARRDWRPACLPSPALHGGASEHPTSLCSVPVSLEVCLIELCPRRTCVGPGFWPPSLSWVPISGVAKLTQPFGGLRADTLLQSDPPQ